jgi:hypothetical protein
MTWTSYWFRPPQICPGGIIDDPIFNSGTGEVPDYFISDAFPPDRNYTIFDYLPTINPQCYSTTGQFVAGRAKYGTDYNISWLRKADTCEYQRTWFKVTRTWMGAPIGMWDGELYSSGNRPSLPTDYVTKFLSLGG